MIETLFVHESMAREQLLKLPGQHFHEFQVIILLIW